MTDKCEKVSKNFDIGYKAGIACAEAYEKHMSEEDKNNDYDAGYDAGYDAACYDAASYDEGCDKAYFEGVVECLVISGITLVWCEAFHAILNKTIWK